MAEGAPVMERARAAGLAAAACWAAPIALSACSGPDTQAARLAGNLASILFAPLVLLLMTAAGDWLLDRALRLRGALTGRLLFGAALGLGSFSTATLAIGLVFIPPTWAVLAALVLLAVLLALRTGRVLAELRDRLAGGLTHPRAEQLLVILMAVSIVVLAALNVRRAFVPPLDYDVLEYHMAAPANYFRAGRIAFVADNVYASFPETVEMMFLDSMMIRGGVYEGFALARLLNVGLGVLAACAAGAAAGAIFRRRAALPAAAILYTWPQINSIAVVAYVELGMMFYAALALLAGWQYYRSKRPVANLVLFALMCGLAAACKYPAVLFVCVPAGVWVLCVARRKWLAHGLLFAAAALAAASPWMVKNTVYTGNPVYPLLGRTLDGRTWSPRKDARWERAHSPRNLSAGEMWKVLRNTAAERFPSETSPLTMSFLLVAFLPFVFVPRAWRGRALVLLALSLFAVVAWLLTTHQIVRFLVPWLVPLVALNAAGVVAFVRARWLHLLFGVVFVMLLALESWATIEVRAPADETDVLLGRLSIGQAVTKWTEGLTYNQRAIDFINELPPGSRTLFYGEARTLYCIADIVAPTVFDENPLDDVVRRADSPETIRDGLRRLGVTHIYVNIPELSRLQWSYAFDWDGRHWNGYSTLFDNEAQERNLSQFLVRYCRFAFPPLLRPPWSSPSLEPMLYTIARGHSPERILPFYVYEIMGR